MPTRTATATPEEEATVSVDEAHQLIGKKHISRMAIYDACKSGEIPAIRFKGRVLIPRAWLTAKLKGTK